MKFLLHGVLLFLVQATKATIILDCTYSMANWDHIGNVYTCYPKLLQLDGGNNVVGVTQNHLSGKSNADVAAINIGGQAVNQIPSNIESFFENLLLIHIESTTLKSISRKDFKPFPKLKSLRIHNSLVEKVHGDTLIDLPSLIRFYLIGSKLTNVGPGLLQHSTTLTSVNFSGSLCITSSADNATQIAALTRELAHKCPPSVEMTEEIILEGENFQDAVNGQVEPELQVIGARVEKLEEKNERADERIDELEKFIFNLCTTHAICT